MITMSGFRKYPYQDYNGFNLDWIIEKIKAVEVSDDIAEEALEKAENAQATADSAAGTAQQALTTANTAEQTAANAQTAAANAQTAADAAQTTADAAQTAAANAQTAAGAAQATADAAQTAAANAQTDADAAQTTANTANTTANAVKSAINPSNYTTRSLVSNNYFNAGSCKYIQFGKIVLARIEDLTCNAANPTHGLTLFNNLPKPKANFVFLLPRWTSGEGQPCQELRLQCRTDGTVRTHYAYPGASAAQYNGMFWYITN